MTHPLFRSELFIETAFARRFQAMLRSAWHKRSWHVIVADPGSGKTTSIRDLLKTTGGRSVLAVVAPKNNDDEQALGDQFFTALGLPLRGHWSTRKPKLMGHLHQYGTEFLVVDDAHDLSLEHLMLIKEVTDQGHLQYGHPLGLCLVAAGRGATIPLKETLDLPDPTWLQFRNSAAVWTNSNRSAGLQATHRKKSATSWPPWKRCSSNSFRSSTCTNGQARFTPGSRIRSSTRPTQAAPRWIT